MENEESAEMTWVIKLSTQNRVKFGQLKIVYVVGVVAAIVFAIVTKNIVYPLLGVSVLFASTYDFVQGKKYRLTQSMAKAGNTEITWPLVKSVHIGEDEIYLSPFEQESKLDAFRGVKLSMLNVSKENVLEFIRGHVGKDVRFLER